MIDPTQADRLAEHLHRFGLQPSQVRRTRFWWVRRILRRRLRQMDWLVPVGRPYRKPGSGAVVHDLRIRRWHPGYWLFVVRAVFVVIRGIRVELGPKAYLVRVQLWNTLATWSLRWSEWVVQQARLAVYEQALHPMAHDPAPTVPEP